MYIIDRFEEDRVILEADDESFIALPVDAVPSYAREGDVLCYDGSSFIVDEEATRARRERIKRKLRRLFDKGKS